jgi:PKD repeat protein
MRKRIQMHITRVIFALLLLPMLQASAQTSVTFKPDGTVGEDVFISTSYGCTPAGFPQPAENTNWEMCGDLSYADWTINSLNCSTTASKTLIRFTQMSTLPPTAVINYAELRLWTPFSSGCIPQGNSYFPGSGFPSNEGWVSRVTSGWTETGVTWNTQPGITTVNQTPAPPTNLQWNDYMAIDVTSLTQDIWASMAGSPANNNGYMLELQNQAYYRSTVFAGSGNPYGWMWPELYIELDCDANFNLCNTSRYPNTFDFSVMYIDPTATYKWDFGDGNSGSGTSIQHTYSTTGTFRVCLTVISRNGTECRKCIEICIDTVVPPPPRYGDYDPIRRCDAHFRLCNSTLYPNTYNFTPLYPEPGASYSWDFGDGTPSVSGQDVTHSYMTPGTYTICMTKTLADGRRCTECVTICVNEIVKPPVDNDDPDGAAKQSLNAPGSLYNADGGLLIDRVYPNPASADLNIELVRQQEGDVTYAIYSLDGRLLLNGQHTMSKGTQNFSIAIDKLPAGMYMLEVKDGQSQARYKFIKE